MKVSKYFSFSDEQLFNLIENGDKMAFTEAYNKYHRLLYSVSYRYLMDSAICFCTSLGISFGFEYRYKSEELSVYDDKELRIECNP